jgi:hypothetical protein
MQAGRAKHDPNDKEWEDDWRNVVYIDLPAGQVSWHFHDSHSQLLNDLGIYTRSWDGHSTDEKYKRVLNPGSFFQCWDTKYTAELKEENQRLKHRIDNLRIGIKEVLLRPQKSHPLLIFVLKNTIVQDDEAAR